jgi:ketol-acid reductoisomerase
MSFNKKIFFDNDITLDHVIGKTVGIIGYGNQARAQANNLKDSGCSVIVGLKPKSPSEEKVLKDGFELFQLDEVFAKADILSVLIPDNNIPKFLSDHTSNIKKGQTLLFSHGYSIVYGDLKIPNNINVIMVAPSGGGKIVRNEFKKGFGVPALVAVEKDYSGEAFNIALSYAKAIGSSRAAVFLSTFKEETETDLFGEQVILTGSIPLIIIESYKVLLEEGYSPIVSWFVCFYELKTIVDLMFEKGLSAFYDMISNTARYGGVTRGAKLIDSDFKEKIRNILSDIKSGQFKEELDLSLSKGDDGRLSLKEIFDSKDFDFIEKELLKRVKQN